MANYKLVIFLVLGLMVAETLAKKKKKKDDCQTDQDCLEFLDCSKLSIYKKGAKAKCIYDKILDYKECDCGELDLTPEPAKEEDEDEKEDKQKKDGQKKNG